MVSKYSNPTSAQYRRKRLRSTRDNTLAADWFDEYDSFVELSRELTFDRVPTSALDLSDRLEDKSIAVGFLLLLDEYSVGKIVAPN